MNITTLALTNKSAVRTCQIDINNAINTTFNQPNINKGILKAFCGTGKSFIMAHADIVLDKKLICIVMPSLQLCDQ